MPDAKNFRIMTNVDCGSFLHIEKTPSGSYIVKFFPQSITYDFISIVVEMLQEYGDVFAAYVNTMDPDLPLVENYALITIFPTTVKETKVLVVKTDESATKPPDFPTTIWESRKVNLNLDGLSKFTVYEGHLYVFTKECTGQPNDTSKSSVDYDTKSLKQLKVIAKERKIYGYTLMKRNEIINALRESE